MEEIPISSEEIPISSEEIAISFEETFKNSQENTFSCDKKDKKSLFLSFLSQFFIFFTENGRFFPKDWHYLTENKALSVGFPYKLVKNAELSVVSLYYLETDVLYFGNVGVRLGMGRHLMESSSFKPDKVL